MTRLSKQEHHPTGSNTAPPVAGGASGDRHATRAVLGAYGAVQVLWGSTYLASPFGIATIPRLGRATPREG